MQVFSEYCNYKARDGDVAGKARRDLERKSGKKVASKKNYLKAPQDKKLLKGRKGE